MFELWQLKNGDLFSFVGQEDRVLRFVTGAENGLGCIVECVAATFHDEWLLVRSADETQPSTRKVNRVEVSFTLK